LQAELAQKTALLELAQGDLTRDEQIFADKVREVARLQAELSDAAERAHARVASMAARLQHAQADVRRCVLCQVGNYFCSLSVFCIGCTARLSGR
jgi:hypothetical protein